jgi:predicted Fe-S protein YdhL (DUF1289 family)
MLLCAVLCGGCDPQRHQLFRWCHMQIASAEEEVDRLTASKASAQAEADEADAAAQQALETGHAEVRGLACASCRLCGISCRAADALSC